MLGLAFSSKATFLLLVCWCGVDAFGNQDRGCALRGPTRIHNTTINVTSFMQQHAELNFSAPVYDPALPTGAPSLGLYWMSYLIRGSPLYKVDVHRQTFASVSSPFGHIPDGNSAARVLSANASRQGQQWWRVDAHLTGITMATNIQNPVIWNISNKLLEASGFPALTLELAAGSFACAGLGEGAGDVECYLTAFCDSLSLGDIICEQGSVPSWSPPLGARDALVTLHARAAPLQLQSSQLKPQQMLHRASQRTRHVMAGRTQICVIQWDYSLWCWGHNGRGQLGIGSFIDAEISVPQRVKPHEWGEDAQPQKRVKILSGGTRHACAGLEDGSLWCWGRGNGGASGNGLTTDANTPQLASNTEWAAAPSNYQAKQVSAGTDFACAVLLDASIWCWGSNGYGKPRRLGRRPYPPHPSESGRVGGREHTWWRNCSSRLVSYLCHSE